MGDLRLRRPLDVQLQMRRLLPGECLQRGEGDRALRQTVVHERKIVLQNNAVVVAPVRRHRRLVQAIQGGLHPGAIGEHRAAP
jgi:hypothetical protein